MKIHTPGAARPIKPKLGSHTNMAGRQLNSSKSASETNTDEMQKEIQFEIQIQIHNPCAERPTKPG